MVNSRIINRQWNAFIHLFIRQAFTTGLYLPRGFSSQNQFWKMWGVVQEQLKIFKWPIMCSLLGFVYVILSFTKSKAATSLQG